MRIFQHKDQILFPDFSRREHKQHIQIFVMVMLDLMSDILM
jgi:hypothetical protein